METIKQMVESDLKIDGTELGDESIRIPMLHGKFLNIFHDESLVLRKLNSDYSVLKKQKWEWYGGKADEDQLKSLGWEPFATRILRQDLELYMEADPDLIRLGSKIDLQKAKVEYLDSVIKGINNRQWVIRNAIEWRKFMSGVS
jgi:hypothetical protein